MHGIKTIERINANNREADRIMAAHGHATEARAPYGVAVPAPKRDLLFQAFPDTGEALLAPLSVNGASWLAFRYPEYPHDGIAVVLRDPDEITSAVATAEACGLRVN